MKQSEFFDLLRNQCTILPWIHAIGGPARDLEQADLPGDYRELLAEADGLALNQMRMHGEMVGAAFEIPSAADTVPLAIAMYGRNGPEVELPGNLHRSRMVGRHTDGSFYVGLDPVTSTYYSVDPIVRETEIVARSCGEYLAWLVQFIPSREELDDRLARDTEA